MIEIKKIKLKKNKTTKQTTVALEPDQIKFIKRNNINLSALVRDVINQLMVDAE